MERVKFSKEFIFRASPAILYQFLSTPDCLIRWFCDQVHINGRMYTFEWNGAEEEAELIDFALDLVVDAYGKNLEEGGIVDQLKEKYRGTEARAFVDQLRRRCYIATDLD